MYVIVASNSQNAVVIFGDSRGHPYEKEASATRRMDNLRKRFPSAEMFVTKLEK